MRCNPVWLLIVGCYLPGLLAQNSYQYCQNEPLETHPSALSAAERENLALEITANYAEIINQTVTLQGEVQIQRGDQQLQAEQAYYDDPQQKISAQGQVHYQDFDFDIEAEQVEWRPLTKTGWLQQAQYQLPPYHARGEADSIYWIEGEQAQLQKVTYTTCPLGDGSWLLSAKSLEIDQTHALGKARDAKLAFKGVPFLYTPYLRFPLDDRRRSGWLTPALATTEETGFDVRVPYYMNIAPDQDATLTPRILTRRGLMLGTEYRYLTETGDGRMVSELLPHDSVFGSGRGQLSWRHSSRLAPRWALDIDANYASDSDYFEDFGSNLSVSSITHLERRLRTRWDGSFWFASAMIQGYQTVDESLSSEQRPYQRLPQLLFNLKKPGIFGLVYDVQAEWTYFDRDDSVTGSRFDVSPRLEWPRRTAATFVVPAVSLRYTQYDLNNTAFDATPDRLIPTLSVDSGLFFERDLPWQGQALLQTLEPRFFYLYVPEQDQDQLPVFDAGELDFSFSQLFQENRFVGADRVGDANQLTLALSSRLLTARDGAEHLRASVGQIWYFQPRQVALPDQPVTDSHQSALVAEVHSNLIQNWSTRGTWQWDPDQNQTDKGVVHLHYQSDKQHILNLAYRFRRDALEQTDISWRWPLSSQWNMVGRWNYSLLDRHFVETFGGVEHDSCCWSTRLVLRDHVNSEQGDQNLSLYFELELKGLSKISNKIDHLLETGILGYQR